MNQKLLETIHAFSSELVLKPSTALLHDQTTAPRPQQENSFLRYHRIARNKHSDIVHKYQPTLCESALHRTATIPGADRRKPPIDRYVVHADLLHPLS